MQNVIPIMPPRGVDCWRAYGRPSYTFNVQLSDSTNYAVHSSWEGSPAFGRHRLSLNVELASRLLSQNDLHSVGPAVVDERDRHCIDGRPV